MVVTMEQVQSKMDTWHERCKRFESNSRIVLFIQFALIILSALLFAVGHEIKAVNFAMMTFSVFVILSVIPLSIAGWRYGVWAERYGAIIRKLIEEKEKDNAPQS